MTAPTSTENLKRINSMFDSISDLVENLAARWSQEKEYEDINDYRAVIQKKLPVGFKITTMTKRPFGFKFSIGTNAEYSVYCNSSNIGWKRLK